MVANLVLIGDELDRRLLTKHKLETFALYFLRRLVLINLDVAQTDVAMVFEVINDRGVGLKPHEILKGKLLGQIDKVEVDPFAQTWEEVIGPLDARSTDTRSVPDDFLRTYFKARFDTSRRESHTHFDGDYQRAVFLPQFDAALHFKHQPDRSNVSAIKVFIKEELPYYAALFQKAENLASKHDPAFASVYYNGLTDMDSQALLILAACTLHDDQEDDKIRAVARELDRYYVLLQLNKAYDSNRFADSLYDLRRELHELSIDDYRSVFDEALMSRIGERRDARPESPLLYSHFKQVSRSDFNIRFIHYFLARIEEYIAKGIGRQMQDDLYELVRRRSYHIEHILSNNDENLKLFENDQDEFDRERNRLGGLLLLKARDNQSSGNEPYEEKLRTYAGTLYWNQTLHPDFYKSKLKHVEFLEETGIPLTSVSRFDADALEKRSLVLFTITQKIWDL